MELEFREELQVIASDLALIREFIDDLEEVELSINGMKNIVSTSDELMIAIGKGEYYSGFHTIDMNKITVQYEEYLHSNHIQKLMFLLKQLETIITRLEQIYGVIDLICIHDIISHVLSAKIWLKEETNRVIKYLDKDYTK